jgi:signal transduction histidine kinase
MNPTLTFIFFAYGLAFFSMGLLITLEVSRGPEARLRHALRPLAGFGLIHAAHEWIDMFKVMGYLPGQSYALLAWESLRLALLAFSFVSLGAFGASLLSPSDRVRRLSLLVPLTMTAVWGFGVLYFRGRFGGEQEPWAVTEVWTRYVLGIPAALIASAGLIAQQRNFRQAGMAQFGRDCLWAAVAFAWYGAVGQLFTQSSPLPPSNVINAVLFQQLFGFPIQLLRAVTAAVASFFVIRFLRSFEVETQRQIAVLQSARLEESQRRETLRGDLLRQVVEAQEAERQRVARDLHDETGQALTAIGLGLRSVATAYQSNPQKAENNLRQLESLVDRALDELQRLIADLRPSHLDDLGLPAALRWYAAEIHKRANLPVHIEIRGEGQELPQPVNLVLFRVAQEALTNVVRHARARHVWVRVRLSEAEARVEVEDDGVGFEVDQASPPDHPAWGMLGMRERTSLLGGRLELRSSPGRGTTVSVTIPFRVDKRGADGDSPAAH